MLQATVVRSHHGGRADTRLRLEGCGQPEPRDRARQRITRGAPAATFERRGFVTPPGQEDDVESGWTVLVVAGFERHQRSIVEDGGVDGPERFTGAGTRTRRHPDLADLLDQSRIGSKG